jgi:DNA-binding GntR family transcriptional regulator
VKPAPFTYHVAQDVAEATALLTEPGEDAEVLAGRGTSGGSIAHAVYQYSRSPLLMSLMRLLWASLHGGPRVRRTHAESARQHEAILDALSAADADAASTLICQHIMGAERLGGP